MKDNFFKKGLSPEESQALESELSKEAMDEEEVEKEARLDESLAKEVAKELERGKEENENQ